MSNPYLEQQRIALEWARRRVREQAERIAQYAETESASTLLGIMKVMQDHLLNIAELEMEIKMLKKEL